MGDSFVQVIPVRVVPLDQCDLPCTAPMLHGSLALDRAAYVWRGLKPYQPLHPISPGEAIGYSQAVFMDAPHRIVCDSDVKRSVPATAHDVNAIIRHDSAR